MCKRRLLLIFLTSAVTLYLLYFFGLEPLTKFFSILFDRLTYFKLDISHSPDDVKFFLWTSRTKLEFSTVSIGDRQGLEDAGYKPRWPVKIMIHGFSDSAITSWTDRLRKKYLASGDYNVFTVEWESLAKSPWFNSACKNTEVVGQVTANFLDWLVENKLTSWDSVHILGSSLGGHAAGYAGRFTGGKIARITGLDPSGPLFHSVSTLDRLDQGDARFVDVIHAAGHWIGNEDVMGHVDFFPNGGRSPQPGCEGKESLDLSCSHFRAWVLFGESIDAERNSKQNKLVAVKCSSYSDFLSGVCCRGNLTETAILGEGVNQSTTGTFYLKTGPTSHFALHLSESTNC